MFLDLIRTTIANNGYEVISCGILSAFFAQVGYQLLLEFYKDLILVFLRYL